MKTMIDTTPISYQPETVALLGELDEVSENVFKLDNLTTKVDSKTTVIDQLTGLINRAEERKKTVQRRDCAQRCANRILAIELTAQCWRNSLRMWINLRNESWEQAWSSMVRAQRLADSAIAADKIAENFYMRNYVKRLRGAEKLLFPKQMFTSTGLKTGPAECTICGEEYSSCEHLKGLAYNGEICRVKITDIVDIDHVAIVEEPSDKMLRIGSFE